MSQFGLAARCQAGKLKDLGSIPLQLSVLFKSCGLWTLWLCPSQLMKHWNRSDCCPFNAGVMSLWWWQCSIRYGLHLAPPPVTVGTSRSLTVCFQSQVSFLLQGQHSWLKGWRRSVQTTNTTQVRLTVRSQWWYACRLLVLWLIGLFSFGFFFSFF